MHWKVLKCKGKPCSTLGSYLSGYTHATAPIYSMTCLLKPNNPIHKVRVFSTLLLCCCAKIKQRLAQHTRGTRRDEENFSNAPSHTHCTLSMQRQTAYIAPVHKDDDNDDYLNYKHLRKCTHYKFYLFYVYFTVNISNNFCPKHYTRD